MTTGGWLTMIVSVGFVTVLFTWCIGKVLSLQGDQKRIHGIEDIEKGED